MKKFRSLVMLSAVALGFGLTSCSSSDDSVSDSQANALKGTTYAALSIQFPTTTETRSLPEDYNKMDQWQGNDKVNTVSVFLYNETLNTIDYSKFSQSSFAGIDANGYLKPNLAVKATPGEKVKAYVVINDVNDKVTTTLQTAAATPNTFATAFAAEVNTVANQVSSFNGTNDIIMMTNDVVPTAVTVAPSITQTAAINGPTNLIKVNVQRVVSRAIVTVKSDIEKTIQLYDASGNPASKITFDKLTYGVGQSGQSFFNLQKTSFLTPSTIYNGNATLGATLMDNTGLNAFLPVTSIATNTNANVVTALKSETEEKFVLPVTHPDAAYFKGNTTYFEVRATFTPDKVDGVAYTDTGKDVYLGQNDGLFYSTRELAEANGQSATGFKGAVCKYILWLNPNVIPGSGSTKTSMSPTVRNHVYNVFISGFKTIGVPNNPLNPGSPTDPTKPVGPDNPIDPTNPVNPVDPSDPKDPTNPIKPTDPLETEDTYLSVDITVLPYTVHSYGVEIGTDY